MRPLGLFISFAIVLATATPRAVLADDQETQIGAQVYAQLQQKGEIIARPNALYDSLDPIAARIKRIADPQYQYPFTFILVHEKSPNAFAVPGGHVYVTDSLMSFVQNKEELAGVLCHETSHDIHHDVVNNNTKNEMTGALIGILGSLAGIDRSNLGQFSESAIYTLGSDHFSRTVESNADHKGAETCAEAGSNPWGMVWLFENFEKADTGGSMEALSDHPTNQHRIDALKQYFANDPKLFGAYSRNIATGTPLGLTALPMRRIPVAPATSSTYCCAPKQ